MYCTVQDLIARFGEDEMIALTDRNDTGDIDTAVAEQAIADASEEITAYLKDRPISATLTRFACDLANYYLRYPNITDQMQLRYNAIIRYLELVAQGKITLASSNPPAINAATIMQSKPTVFGRE